MAAGTIAAFHEQRMVYVCDSFQGLPRASNPMDFDGWEVSDVLSVPMQTVKQNFKNSNLLGPNLRFIKGFFNDSLPALRSETFKLAVLRADGDMYESTMDILFNTYDKLSLGGFLIIDDWHIDVCRKAVKHFFYIHGITHIRVEPIDGLAAYVVKQQSFEIKYGWYEKFNAQRKVTSKYTTRKGFNSEQTGRCRAYPHACMDEFSSRFADSLM
jgi:hypothetical protein